MTEHGPGAGEPPVRLDPDFRRLMETLPCGAYTCDATGLITWYNPRAVEIWGREPRLHDRAERYCGSSKLFAPDGSPVLHSQCWTALALMLDRRFDAQELVIERPTTERVRVLAYASPLHDASGRLLGAACLLVDISERRQREPQGLHAERLASLGALAGGIANDFNNLLTAVLANASLAMISLPADSPARPMLRDVEGAAREAAGLARQMLAYATNAPALTPSAEEPALVEGPHRDPAHVPRAAGLVLVVDDSETVRSVTQRALQTAGFEVVAASDGIEAIEIFQARCEEVAAILLDLTMPRMHGLEAFKRLRAIDPEIPILVMSGYNEAEVSTRFEGLHATGFVQKPFRAQDVITRLTQVIPLRPRE